MLVKVGGETEDDQRGKEINVQNRLKVEIEDKWATISIINES
jgi:hypothetical protein